MQHPVSFIAQYHYLDEQIAQRIAAERSGDFGVITIGEISYISTFHVDAFVEAVKEAQGAATESIRARLIYREMNRMRSPTVDPDAIQRIIAHELPHK